MVIDKIDVCIVSKTRVTGVKGLEYLPIGNLIIETSRPLGLARMRAIQKVQTEWFAFIDDDVEIDEGWFGALTKYVQNDVGAVQGILQIKGLGEKWDNALNTTKISPSELKKGERGFTHNVLIRTKCVTDWKPSRSDLSAFEDYEISQHILNKGYRWLRVPVESFHKLSWAKIWDNAIWAMQGWKKLYPSSRALAAKVLRCVTIILFLIATISAHPRANTVGIYQQSACLFGLLQ